jgi:CubicO group peptidase (beta-lactamase class C family)
MPSSKNVILSLSFCLLSTACRTLPNIENDKTVLETTRYARTGDLKAEVDALAQPLITHQRTPGLVVGVLLPDGRRQFFGYGVADKRRAGAPDGATVFAAGSLSKEFLAVLATLLVHDGTLHWSDTVGQLLPQAPLSTDAKKITLLELATHTAGLRNQPIMPQTFRYFVGYIFTGNNFYRHLTADYCLHYLADFKTPSVTSFHYSNLGYGLLGYILEQRTGLTLDALLDRELTQPLGLTHTGYHLEQLPENVPRAQGYAGDEPAFLRRGKPVPDWTFTEFMKGSGALYSNARDLLAFAAAALHPVTPRLEAAFVETRRIPIAWSVDPTADGPLFYQTGIVAGFASYLGVDPTHQTAVVVLENSFHWKDKVGHRLLLRLRGGGS